MMKFFLKNGFDIR